MTLLKWQEIIALASQFTDYQEETTDLIAEHTTVADSSDGYVDPRSQIVISDDEGDGAKGNEGVSSGSDADLVTVITFLLLYEPAIY